MPTGLQQRARLKRGLGRLSTRRPARGVTLLIYHRVGGGSPDERDLAPDDFRRQMDVLADHEVVSLDTALDALEGGDGAPKVVLTFDDGFADVYEHAWPHLRARSLPFTLYLATAYVGGLMHWDGSTAKAAGPALTWDQIAEFAESGLCTIGNHTHHHVRPELLSLAELESCSEAALEHLGVRPRHFAYPWGIKVGAMEKALRSRFRSSATGEIGRNQPGDDPARFRRVPVRQSDPIEFFKAKLHGRLRPERTYDAIVAGAKRLGLQS